MKKMNIQKDLDSRREIALANSIPLFTDEEINDVEPLKSEQNAESKDVSRCEDITESSTGSTKKAKRGRKAQRDSETLPV